MDDETNKWLSRILDAQKDQNDLLRKNLGRIRFSLRTLLILTTMLAIGMGIIVFLNKRQPGIPTGLVPLPNPTTQSPYNPTGNPYTNLNLPDQRYAYPNQSLPSSWPATPSVVK